MTNAETWSQPHRGFCCKTYGLACPAPSPGPAAPEPYNCQEELAKGSRSSTWSVLKQAYCCQRKAVACPTSASQSSTPVLSARRTQFQIGEYDCQVGLDNWQRNW